MRKLPATLIYSDLQEDTSVIEVYLSMLIIGGSSRRFETEIELEASVKENATEIARNGSVYKRWLIASELITVETRYNVVARDQTKKYVKVSITLCE